jgi:hypothetical protein
MILPENAPPIEPKDKAQVTAKTYSLMLKILSETRKKHN